MRWIAIIGLAICIMGSAAAKEGVILLHGLARTNSSMAKMAAPLADAGYVAVNVGYPSRTATIDELSDAAIGSALRHESLLECRKINFVTHSLGGILVRAYFKNHSEPRLGRVVMLGPPNQGSELADKLGDWWLYQKINGPAGNELGTTTDSKPNQLGPVEFELGIIAGDRSINWINSLIIPGEDDGKVSVERIRIEGMKAHLVIHAPHPFIMKNKTAIAQTIEFLKTGQFSPSETLP
jgi:triacylglycerol lipase